MPKDSIVELNKLVIKEINLLRTTKRKAALKENTFLQQAASLHVEYLVEKNRLTHTQTNRKLRTPTDRVEAVKEDVFEIVGENILYTELDEAYNLVDLSKEIATIWRKSSSHYKNIMYSKFEEVGYAYKVSEDGLLYVVQVLGKKYND